MKARILMIAALSILFFSCEKNATNDIVYRITNSSSGFEVNYLEENGNLVKETVITQSAQDVWTYHFNAMKGDVVFVSAIYKDLNSSIKVQIYMNGKVFKEGSSTSDTVNYVVVSGSIPF